MRNRAAFVSVAVCICCRLLPTAESRQMYSSTGAEWPGFFALGYPTPPAREYGRPHAV